MSGPRSPAEDLSARSDDELIRRFLGAREEAAFRELYHRHTPAAYGLLLRLSGGDESDASDVLQEAWIRAATKLATFRGASRFRTWLTGIVLNCYREWRRARSSRSSEDDNGEEETAALTTAVDSRFADIEQVLRAMPHQFREVLLLHDVEGYTHAEIAAALEIEPGTSKSRLSRARQMFRAWWRNERDEVTHDR